MAVMAKNEKDKIVSCRETGSPRRRMLRDFVAVNADAFLAEVKHKIFPPAQQYHCQHQADALGKPRGDCCAGSAPAQSSHQQHVQHDIGHAGNANEQNGPLLLSPKPRRMALMAL